MDIGLLGLMLYCAGIVAGVIFASWIIELIDNARNNWQSRVTARDIEELKTIFETDDEPDMVLYSKFVIK